MMKSPKVFLGLGGTCFVAFLIATLGCSCGSGAAAPDAGGAVGPGGDATAGDRAASRDGDTASGDAGARCHAFVTGNVQRSTTTTVSTGAVSEITYTGVGKLDAAMLKETFEWSRTDAATGMPYVYNRIETNWDSIEAMLASGVPFGKGTSSHTISTSFRSDGMTICTFVTTRKYDPAGRVTSDVTTGTSSQMNTTCGSSDVAYSAWDELGRPTMGTIAQPTSTSCPVQQETVSYDGVARTVTTRRIGDNSGCDESSSTVTYDENGNSVASSSSSKTSLTASTTTVTETEEVCLQAGAVTMGGVEKTDASTDGTAPDAPVVDPSLLFPDLSGCKPESISAAEGAAYFPYTPGARWMFRDTGSSNDIPIGPRLSRREVTGTKMVGAASAAVMFGPEEDLNPSTMDDYWDVTTDGLVYRGGSTPSTQLARPAIYAAPFVAIPFPISTCQARFQYSVSNVDLGSPLRGTGRSTAMLSFEDVTTPIGAFKHCLRVETIETFSITGGQYTQGSSTRTIDWYASGVGPVKRVVDRGVKTDAELIAYSVNDARHGVVATGYVGSNLSQGPSNPYQPNRPAVAFDGTNFLVVVPTSRDVAIGFSTGNLMAALVNREGGVVRARELLDAGDEFGSVAAAWDGKRYLVVYDNLGYGRTEMLTVSAAGDTIDGPIALEPFTTSPSILAANDGFLVSYGIGKPQVGTQNYLANMWVVSVDGTAHPTVRVQPFPDSQQHSPLLARDGAGGIMSFFFKADIPTPPATAPFHLAAARLTADGHALDAVPFDVDVGATATNNGFIFDGTNFVATWLQPDLGSMAMHARRISPTGALLDGPASPSGGIVVGHGNNPRIGRLGNGSLIVWGHQLTSDFFSQGVGGTRMDVSGKLLDVPGDNGGAWFLEDYGAGRDSLTEILWGGDRALVVWANPSTTANVFSVGGAMAYPW